MQVFHSQLSVSRSLRQNVLILYLPRVLGNLASSQKVFITCLYVNVIPYNHYSLSEYDCHFM